MSIERADFLHLATLTLGAMKLNGKTTLGKLEPLGTERSTILRSAAALAAYWQKGYNERSSLKGCYSYAEACRLVGWAPPMLDTLDAER